jgi:chromosome segregation ATPase
MLQCDCPAGAIFAGAPGEPAPPAAPLPPDPSTSAALELAELRRRVPELEDIIARGSAANEKQHAELVELRSAIDAGDKTVTALRERAELAEAQRDNLQRELDATRAAAADTARVDATEVAREVDAARKKAK